jgi:Protein of unknown function (DUF1569)
MRRRSLIVAAAGTPVLLSACGSPPVAGFATLAEASKAVEALQTAGWRTVQGWALAQVLVHLAQSIEYSMAGFPVPKSALFQSTVGSAAFAWFDARGLMTHSLTEPIPGAPSLEPAPPLAAATERLHKALRDFEGFGGTLRPHFAYGALDKPAYTRAHLMHLANHWTEVVRS